MEKRVHLGLEDLSH